MSEADNILTAREREIEKKEMEITLQHQKLIKNEKQLVVKITILDMAIQANQFRYFFLYLIKYKKCKFSFFQTWSNIWSCQRWSHLSQYFFPPTRWRNPRMALCLIAWILQDMKTSLNMLMNEILHSSNVKLRFTIISITFVYFSHSPTQLHLKLEVTK